MKKRPLTEAVAALAFLLTLLVVRVTGRGSAAPDISVARMAKRTALAELARGEPSTGREGSSPAEPSRPADGVTTLDFDAYADGTRISDQYSASGIHFLNDHAADALYRSSPQIKAYGLSLIHI